MLFGISTTVLHNRLSTHDIISFFDCPNSVKGSSKYFVRNTINLLYFIMYVREYVICIIRYLLLFLECHIWIRPVIIGYLKFRTVSRESDHTLIRHTCTISLRFCTHILSRSIGAKRVHWPISSFWLRFRA